MKHQHPLQAWSVILTLAAVSFSLVGSANAQTITASTTVPGAAPGVVGTFDPAGGATLGVYAGALTATDLANWQSTVATAFAGGLGGVWNSANNGAAGDRLDTGATVSVNQFNVAQLTYGTGKTLQINSSVLMDPTVFSSAIGSSGAGADRGRVIAPSNNGGTVAYTLALSLIGANNTGELISSFGLALAPRSGAVGVVTLTANFSGGGSQALTTGSTLTSIGANILPYGDAVGAFFQWTAPVGQSITSIAYSSTLGRVNPLDDLSWAVTPVPEPGTLALFGLGALVVTALRRKQSGR